MATVSFQKAQRWYPGMDKPAVPGIDLDIKDGEFMVLVGPSGCGKSTTLRMLAGLEEVNDGKIFIGDRDVTKLPPKDRDIAMVFQNYALYPHMTVADNMAFWLKMAKMKESERKERVAEAARILNLTEYLDRKPKALSGGQRQRVAMGRAIVRNPQVFCMDEPLSNLDAKMRVQTRTDIAKLQQRPRRHHRLRDPRPGRGHDDGRPGRGDEGRLPPAGRHPAEPLRPPGQPVRGRLHRLAADEPALGHAVDGKAKIGKYLVPVDEAAAKKMKGDVVVGVRPEAWRIVVGRGRRAAGRRSPWSRSSARTPSSTAPAASRAPRATSSCASRPATRAQGRRAPRDHRPPPDPRLRRRVGGTPQRLIRSRDVRASDPS